MLDRADDDDLHRIPSFFSVAQQVFENMANEWQLSPQEVNDLLRRLDPFGCPGVRIEMAVSRALDTSPEPAMSNDEADRAHISFLPYVDPMFADRRTVGFYRQAIVLDKGGVLARDASRVTKSGPSTAIIDAIDRARPIKADFPRAGL